MSQAGPNLYVEDFDIDMTCKKDDETEDLNSQPLDVNDYVEVFAFSKSDVKKDSNGHFNCPECNYKTSYTTNIETHYRSGIQEYNQPVLGTNSQFSGCWSDHDLGKFENSGPGSLFKKPY